MTYTIIALVISVMLIGYAVFAKRKAARSDSSSTSKEE